MRNIIRILIILACLSNNAFGADTMKVFYIPFNIQTYTPVTVTDIESRAHYVFETPSDSSLSKKLIKQLKQKKHDSYNNQMIRLKVVNNNKNYFVDTNCNVKVGDDIFMCNTRDIESTLNNMIRKYNIQKKSLPGTERSN